MRNSWSSNTNSLRLVPLIQRNAVVSPCQANSLARRDCSCLEEMRSRCNTIVNSSNNKHTVSNSSYSSSNSNSNKDNLGSKSKMTARRSIRANFNSNLVKHLLLMRRRMVQTKGSRSGKRCSRRGAQSPLNRRGEPIT